MQSERLGNLLGAAGVALGDDLVGALATDGEAPSAGSALLTLRIYDGRAPLSLLSRTLRLTHSGTVRLVDSLQRRDLVAREPGAEDRRSVDVVLTAGGRAHAQRLSEARARALEGWLAPLEDDERATLERLLEKLLFERSDGRATAQAVCRMCDAVVCGHAEGRCPVTLGADAAVA